MILKLASLNVLIRWPLRNQSVRIEPSLILLILLVTRPYAVSSGDESILSNPSQRSRASSGSKKDRHVSMGHVEMRILDVESEQVITVSDYDSLRKKKEKTSF